MKMCLKYSILLLSASLVLTSCSITRPGMPNLISNPSKEKQTAKAGIDYKIITINANTIKNQKPVSYSSAFKNSLSKQDYSHRPSRISSYKHSSIKIPTEKSSTDNPRSYVYKLGKHDILNISVWDHPELTPPLDLKSNAAVGYVIDNQGQFYFPYSGKVFALGKSVNEIKDILESRLNKIITEPQVKVSIAEYRSQEAHISGAVKQPIKIAINDVPLTIRSAIAQAGGITEDYTGYAVLNREKEKIGIDIDRLLRNGDNRQNFILKHNDRLQILKEEEVSKWKRELNYELEKQEALARQKVQLEKELERENVKIFVMGEVNKPGTIKYEFEKGMTLAEALNDAGSLKEDTVDPKGIFVVRKENPKDTIPTVYQLSLVSVHSMFYAEEFNLRPRDTVYVTATPSIRWNRVLAQLLPSLTLVNTVRNLSN